MKLTIGILAMGLAVGTAWGQNTDAIENTRDTMKALQQKQVMDQNAALGSSQAQPANPASSAPKSASSSQSASKPKVTSAPEAANPKAEQASITIVRTPKVVPAVKVATGSKGVAKTSASKSAAPKTQVKAVSKAPKAEQVVAVEDKKSAEPKKPEQKKINLTGRRDPFVSPIVNRSMLGSGCSTGKRCLAIDQIALKGVVRSDTGMIAVVTNALDKAYFLHENDPVFNGYVVKITGDSIVFKETVQDKLGKPFMREVTKTITTPAV
jgi:Tfp pilus assembly protein PilP